MLFDGKDLSKWVQRGRGAESAKELAPKWKVGNGYFEVASRTGSLYTRQKFGTCQLHIEWASPSEVRSTSQDRGNSGVLFMSRYEVQVLDAYNNPTYADGTPGSIYGQWPPLALPARKPGEWNVYDIIFEAPEFDGQKLVKPAFLTVFYNGVVVHSHKESMGPMVYRQVAKYTPHAPGGRADVAGPQPPGPLPQHLDTPAGRLRSAGEIAQARGVRGLAPSLATLSRRSE